jgi:hypothetical protein
MGAGGSVYAHQELDLNQYNCESAFDLKAVVDKFMIHRIDSIIEQKEVYLPILRSQSTVNLKEKRLNRKHSRSIRAMSLRNHSRQTMAYDLQRELAINLVTLHKEEKRNGRSSVLCDDIHEINLPVESLDSMNKKDVDERVKLPSLVVSEPPAIIVSPRQETSAKANKIGLGLHSKRPPPLKLSIQDDTDWIQVTNLLLHFLDKFDICYYITFVFATLKIFAINRLYYLG